MTVKPWPYFLLLLTLSCYTSTLTAQVTCTPVYINEYAGAGNGPVEPHAVKALPDGTLLIVGMAGQPGASDYDGFISRHGSDGTPIWSFFVGGTGDDNLTGISPLSDGTFLLYGSTKSFGYPQGKGWLLRIDASGTVLWSGLLGSSEAGTDRVKAIQQYSDGDIVGSFNVNDSSASSDPVIFKMGLDGTLRWTHRFDNGNDDSYTTVAVSGDTVYAGGYYTAAGALQGVITEVRAGTGALILSRNINNGDASFNEQVTGLEIYNNTISYGLYLHKGSNGSGTNAIILVQTDLAGNTRHVTYAQDPYGFAPLKVIRAQDSGFYILRTDNNYLNGPAVDKVNVYGYQSWGIYLADQDDYSTFTAFDMTPDGGCVTAGHYAPFIPSIPNWREQLQLIKMTAKGEIGSCDLVTSAFYVNPTTYSQAAFTWAAEPSVTPLTMSLSPAASPDPLTALTSCAGSVCVDHTPIPSGCGKTYNIQYASALSSVLRDVIPTPDGGRIGVGDLESPPGTIGLPIFNGMVTAYAGNGSITWSRSFNLFGANMQFRRILRTADGNILVLGNNYGTTGNYSDWSMVLLKLDNNGNILWCHFLQSSMTQMIDAVATPDNGFVAIFSDPYDYPWLARFDANANIVWQRQVSHSAFGAVYRAVACSQDAVFVASDGGTDEFSVDRLALATGSLDYSHRYSGGSGTQVTINSIFTDQDTAYVFLYHYVPSAAAPVTNLMFSLDRQGSPFRWLNLGADDLSPNPAFVYASPDGNPPSVTMTPDRDFWLASRINLPGSNYLDVTRFKADGTVEFSKLHTGINGYLPFNVRPQGKGIIAVGTMGEGHTGAPFFTNAFVLKLDSSGQLQTGAAASCQATDRPFPVTVCTTCSAVTTQQETCWDPGAPGISTVTPFNQDNDLTAVLYCFQPGNCNSVNLLQKGAACTINDTLVYYLDNSGSCGAAATWAFDTSYFRPGLISGDSIQLIVQKAGATAVSAQVEGYCSFSIQNKATTIVLSATTGLGLGPDTVICSNGPISLQATPGYASYLWSDNSTGSSLLVSTPGQYSVAAADQCGHIHTALIQVADANAAFHVTRDTIRCNNDVDPLQATGGYSDYQWNPTYNLQAQGNQALVSPDIATRYTVTAQRSPGCTVTASVLVTALTSPPILPVNDTSICSGDSLLLDGTTGFNSYQWNTGAVTEQIYVHQAGAYWLAGVYTNGCISRDTFDLVSLYDPKPALDPNPVFCVGEDRVLDAGGGFSSYLWNDGSTGHSITVTGTGIYWLKVTDQHGCVAFDTVQILTTAQPPKDFLPGDTTVCQYGGLVLKTSQPYDSYSWSDLSSASSLTVDQPGVYWLQVTDGNGCTATDTVTVTPKFCLVGLFVPNAFTPNGNGRNDLFRPLIYGPTELVEFAVYGRYGQRVFQTNSALQGWDGRVNGSPAPAGTYVWYCRYKLSGEPVKLEKGTVILIR